MVSDVKYALAELNKIVEPPSRSRASGIARVAAWKEADPFHYDEDFDGILPQHAIRELWKLTKDRDTIIATGVGQHQMWSAQFYKFRRPRHWLSSGGLGTMGFGLPAAMGAKVAHPDTLVVDIDGDGSLLMNIQEMATCYCEKLPVKVLLLNNQHLGMVVQWEDRFHAANRAHTYLGPIDHPEAIGRATASRPNSAIPTSSPSPRASVGKPGTSGEGRAGRGVAGDDRLARARSSWTCRCPTRSTCCR